MTVTFELPEDIAQALAARGDLSRCALEAITVEGFRQDTLTQTQVGKMLGLARIETEDFLALHADLYKYEPGEMEKEFERLESYAKRKQLL